MAGGGGGESCIAAVLVASSAFVRPSDLFVVFFSRRLHSWPCRRFIADLQGCKRARLGDAREKRIGFFYCDDARWTEKLSDEKILTQTANFDVNIIKFLIVRGHASRKLPMEQLLKSLSFVLTEMRAFQVANFFPTSSIDQSHCAAM